MTTPGILIAVDGGGSKTDAIALTHTGHILARATGPSSSPQNLGLAPAVAVVDEVISSVIAQSGQKVDRVACYLSGLDLQAEIDTFSSAIAPFDWARSTDAPPVIDNDLFALLRVGTAEANAVAVVCGTGINAIGVRADGAQARFPALGPISGDWGGGHHLGQLALWHAARAEDGRGQDTLLRTLVPAFFGLDSVQAVAEALHFQHLDNSVLATLTPVLFEASDAGDTVARSLVDLQIEEIVAMAVTPIRRLELLETELPVVLGGGIVASGNEHLLSGIRNSLALRAPLAQPEVVTTRPVAGAALLVLDQAGADADAYTRLLKQLN